MSVKVTICPDLLHLDSYREAAAETTGRTVGECLDDLARQYPMVKKWLFDDKGELHDFLNIRVNGDEIFPIEQGQPIADGDELAIVVFIAGG